MLTVKKHTLTPYSVLLTCFEDGFGTAKMPKKLFVGDQSHIGDCLMLKFNSVSKASFSVAVTETWMLLKPLLVISSRE
jgi:hypothetical protein